MSFSTFDDRQRRWNRPFLTRQPVDHGGGMSTLNEKGKGSA
jgi:hypothetical protein